MGDYIDREKLIEKLKKDPLFDLVERYGITGVIESIPAADVQPVKRGKWEQKEVFEAKGHVDELQSAFCTACQRYHTTPYSYYFTHYNFCPNCGADMREKQEVSANDS